MFQFLNPANASYEEILGVVMQGRSIVGSLELVILGL